MTTSAPDWHRLQRRSVLLSVELEAFGNYRALDRRLLTVDADPTSVQATKTLLKSPELRAIARLDERLRDSLRAQAFPFPFREGIYLLPLAYVESVSQELASAERERRELVDGFLDTYGQHVTEARTRLRSTFVASDYPPLEVIEESFRFTAQFFRLTIPPILGDRIASDEQVKLDAHYQAAAHAIRARLRFAFGRHLTWLLAALSPDRDEPATNLTTHAWANLGQFLARFPERNLTGDEELDGFVRSLQRILRGIDPYRLRRAPKRLARLWEAVGVLSAEYRVWSDLSDDQLAREEGRR